MRISMKATIGALALASAGQAHAAVQWNAGPGANGHWYDIGAGSASFSQALASATTAAPIAGFSSHLVTVTSVEEANFLFANFGLFGQAWAAGSDAAVEGTWKWVAGPEAGQTFWQNGTTITYAPWNAGTAEPNNAGDEDGLLLHQFGGITWNDAGLGSGYRYIVEYNPNMTGGVPEPASWALMIAGFGLVGNATRRRQRLVSVTYA